MTPRILLAGVSLVSLVAAASPSRAAAPVTLSGGGATSGARVYRDIFNAYSAYNATSAAKNYGVYDSTTISPGNPANVLYPTGPNTLAVQGKTKVVIGFEPVGSGAGLSAYTTANPANFKTPATTNTIAYINSTYTAFANVPYPQIQFASSDTYLGGTQTAQQASTADGNSVNDTNAFQIPVLALPIVLPITGTTAINLTTADVLALFSGNATRSASGTTFSEIVVRADSAGTAFVFSDWLALNGPQAGYTVFSSANGFPNGKPSWSAVFASGTNALPLVFVTGNGGVAAEIANPQNGGVALGFLSPDYAAPYGSANVTPSTLNGISPLVSASNVGTSSDQVFVNINSLPASITKTYDSSTFGQLLNTKLVSPGQPGYPIVAFNFIDAYKCYTTTLASGALGTPAQGTALKSAVANFYPTGIHTNATNVLTGQGFEPILRTSAIYKALGYASKTQGYGPLGAYGIQGKQDPKNTANNFACPAN